MLTISGEGTSINPAAFEINYMVDNAGWYPSYDIRVDNPGEPARLVYKAEVYQNTGVEWKNVLLSFSNATPDRSGNVPVLFPWYIDFIPGIQFAASDLIWKMPEKLHRKCCEVKLRKLRWQKIGRRLPNYPKA